MKYKIRPRTVKPGMCIHCPDEEAAKTLLRLLKRRGYYIDKDDLSITGKSHLFQCPYTPGTCSDVVDSIYVMKHSIEYDALREWERICADPQLSEPNNISPGYRIVEFLDIADVVEE